MQIKADWLASDGAQAIFKMLQDAGYNAYFVGGCVRNAILETKATDIDMATCAPPNTIMALAESYNMRVIPTGIEHGTVTILTNAETIEVTTFRKDTQTDGRRAVIAFSNSIIEDAKRRDFTMNALYADMQGTVIDPLDGLPDLLARRVKFIENANARIREDYLRILRFFRFHAFYGNPDDGLDASALDACARNSDGINVLSKERIGDEMRKLLGADNPAPSIAAMAQTGVLMRVIANANPTPLSPLVHLENKYNVKANWVRRLLALGGEDVKNALRLSKQEMRQLMQMKPVVEKATNPRIAGYKLGADHGLDAVLVLSAILGTDIPDNTQQELLFGSKAKFPVSAHDLSDKFSDAALGNCLRKLESAWIDANLNLTRTQLLTLSKNIEQ